MDVMTKKQADALVEQINAGEADHYLEALLAAAHGRKRYIRGVRSPYGLRVPQEAS